MAAAHAASASKTVSAGMSVSHSIKVEQYAAAGGGCQSGDEFEFTRFGYGELDVGRNVFDQDTALQARLHDIDSRTEQGERITCVRQWQEIVPVLPAERAPAQMLRHPLWRSCMTYVTNWHGNNAIWKQ